MKNKINIIYSHQWSRHSSLSQTYRRAFQVMQYGSDSQKRRVKMIINGTDQFAFMDQEQIDKFSEDIHDVFFNVLDKNPQISRGGFRYEIKEEE